MRLKLNWFHGLVAMTLLAASCAEAPSGKNAWGDTGDGKYANPVLAADYSDPDVIRLGDKYYMVASDFHFMGMQVLESVDLVNSSPRFTTVSKGRDGTRWSIMAKALGHLPSATTTGCFSCISAPRTRAFS